MAVHQLQFDPGDLRQGGQRIRMSNLRELLQLVGLKAEHRMRTHRLAVLQQETLGFGGLEAQ